MALSFEPYRFSASKNVSSERLYPKEHFHSCMYIAFLLPAILAQYPATKMGGLQATTAETRGLTHSGNKRGTIQLTKMEGFSWKLKAEDHLQEGRHHGARDSLELCKDAK